MLFKMKKIHRKKEIKKNMAKKFDLKHIITKLSLWSINITIINYYIFSLISLYPARLKINFPLNFSFKTLG